jgi:hypothetical protein
MAAPIAYRGRAIGRCYHRSRSEAPGGVVDDDESTQSPGAPQRSRDDAAGTPPGLREQVGATFAAGKRLFQAHIDLAKAEMSEIAGSVGRMVGLFAGAFVLMLFAGVLLFVGGILFLGEALFGSIGWGVLLGLMLLIDLALVAVLLALDVSGKRVGTAFAAAAAIGAIVGLVLGFDLTHRGWEALGAAVAPGVDAADRTRNLAVGSLAGIGAILGLLFGIRMGSRDGVVVRALVGAVGGLLIGALLGWLGSITIGAQIGAAIGVLVALIAWPVLAGLDLARAGVDGEALKKKFTPQETITLTKETIEWVRARTPLVPKS